MLQCFFGLFGIFDIIDWLTKQIINYGSLCFLRVFHWEQLLVCQLMFLYSQNPYVWRTYVTVQGKGPRPFRFKIFSMYFSNTFWYGILTQLCRLSQKQKCGIDVFPHASAIIMSIKRVSADLLGAYTDIWPGYVWYWLCFRDVRRGSYNSVTSPCSCWWHLFVVFF